MKPFTLIALLFSSIFSTATAQYFPVDTARLNNAYRTLELGICTEKTEMEFLKAFPTTWLEFYMTYCNVPDEACDNSICDMCTEHTTALFCLSHINDTIKCKKIVDLTIGMKESGECTGVYQDYLVGYIFKNEKLVLDYLSTLRRGHQMQFWQFCWSTVTECDRIHDFENLYNRNKEKYPEEMEISCTAFQYFYDGINYPELFPHKNEKYNHKRHDKKYEYNFDDYSK